MLYVSCDLLPRWIGFCLPLVAYPVIMLMALWSFLRIYRS
jgi:hypothetical protein